MSLRIHYREDTQLPFDGSAMGYANLQALVTRALEMRGVVFDSNSLYALAIFPPHIFTPIAGKYNILLTMWETNQIPETIIEKCNQAELLLVPSTHNLKAFKENGVFRPEIRLCKLGVDTEFWKYKERQWTDGEDFHFLYAANPLSPTDGRKGWELLAMAFQDAFKPADKVKLTCKFGIGKNIPGLARHSYFGNRFIVDNRFLSKDELLSLYHSAHAFVYPSRGEAFGFFPAEAMSTGALVLAPSITGMADFISRHTAIPLDYQVFEKGGHYGCLCDVYNVEPRYLGKKMRNIISWYNSEWLTLKRRAGADYIRKYHSMETLADNLVEAIFNQKSLGVNYGN